MRHRPRAAMALPSWVTGSSMPRRNGKAPRRRRMRCRPRSGPATNRRTRYRRGSLRAKSKPKRVTSRVLPCHRSQARTKWRAASTPRAHCRLRDVHGRRVWSRAFGGLGSRLPGGICLRFAQAGARTGIATPTPSACRFRWHEEPVTQLGSPSQRRAGVSSFSTTSSRCRVTPRKRGRWLNGRRDGSWRPPRRCWARGRRRSRWPAPGPRRRGAVVQRRGVGEARLQPTEEDSAAVDPLVSARRPALASSGRGAMRVMPPRTLLSRERAFKLLSSTGGPRDRRRRCARTFDCPGICCRSPQGRPSAGSRVSRGFTMESPEGRGGGG